MKDGLKIPREGQLDFLSLGALVHRLDPGIVPFRKATECQIHVSGGEYNVAANLADCFRLRTGIVTAMVDYPIGELVAERVRAMGVKPFYKRFEHDGVSGPNIAIVYSDRGYGVRAPVVFYNRSNEAAARLRPGDFDWNEIFAGGVRWFHTGGIFASLSQTTADLIIEGMQAAKAAGAVVSFDLNFREKLWKNSGGRDRAVEVIGRIVENVDVLVGNEEDLQRGLGVAGQTHISMTCDLDVHDRVGGGDGFASGFFYGLLAGESPEDALRLGWAHGALLTTFPGDTSMATLEQVRAFAKGGSARIQR